MSEERRGGMPLHTQIFLGLVLGTGAGIAAGSLVAAGHLPQETLDWVNKYVMTPVGTVFLNMLLMTVIPLVFASISTV